MILPPWPETPSGSLKGDVSKIATQLERTAILLRSEAKNLDGNTERLSKILDREQLHISEALAAISIVRLRTNAATAELRSSRIKTGLRSSLERRWKEWDETIHEQSAAEPFHIFVERDGPSHAVHEGGKLIGFVTSYEKDGATVHGLRNPLNVQLKGSYGSVEVAIVQLRLEFRRLMLTRGG